MQRLRLKRWHALAGVLAISAGGAATALADQVVNEVTYTSTAGEIQPNGTDAATVTYSIKGEANKGDGGGPGDAFGNCNASENSPITVSISVPADAAADKTNLSFTDCTTKQNVTFTASTPGDKTITHSVSGGVGATTNAADFTLKVGTITTPPPANSAPQVLEAALDAIGTKGDTLLTSGSFSDPDGDSLTLSADPTEGSFTDTGDGTWTWSLNTDDDVALGTITVTATDGSGATATDSFDYSAVNADPVLGALTLGGTNCSPTIAGSFTDAGSADAHEGTIGWGDNSTADVFSASPFGPVTHAYASAGTYTITVDVTDDDDGTDSETTSHKVNNIPTSVQQPINTTGARSAFKLGSTVAVKIGVTGCDGQVVGSLAPAVSVVKLDAAPDGTEMEPTSTASPTAGTTMRFDSAGSQYIYNLGTKSLSAGDWKVKITDASFGAPVEATFSLRK
jgi:hypothetical protein